MNFKKIVITLDKPRQLKLSIKGWREFEAITSINLLESSLDDLAPNELYALIWACLIYEDKELKIDDIPALIENSDMTEILKSLLECIQTAFPEAKTEQPPLAGTPSKSIGDPCGVSESTASIFQTNNSGTYPPAS